jgi:DNA polymerase-3 subunit alpha
MDLIRHAISHRINELEASKDLGKRVILGGALTSIRKVYTKRNNSEMAFGTLSDNTSQVDLVIFPKTYAEIKNNLEEDKVYLCEGKIDNKEDTLSMLVDKISPVNEKDMNYLQQSQIIEIEVPKATTEKTLKELSTLLKNNLGTYKVALLLPNGGDIPKRINLPYKIDWSDQLKHKVKKVLG